MCFNNPYKKYKKKFKKRVKSTRDTDTFIDDVDGERSRLYNVQVNGREAGRKRWCCIYYMHLHTYICICIQRKGIAKSIMSKERAKIVLKNKQTANK